MRRSKGIGIKENTQGIRPSNRTPKAQKSCPTHNDKQKQSIEERMTRQRKKECAIEENALSFDSASKVGIGLQLNSYLCVLTHGNTSSLLPPLAQLYISLALSETSLTSKFCPQSKLGDFPVYHILQTPQTISIDNVEIRICWIRPEQDYLRLTTVGTMIRIKTMMTPRTMHILIFMSFHHICFLTLFAPRRKP